MHIEKGCTPRRARSPLRVRAAFSLSLEIPFKGHFRLEVVHRVSEEQVSEVVRHEVDRAIGPLLLLTEELVSPGQAVGPSELPLNRTAEQ